MVIFFRTGGQKEGKKRISPFLRNKSSLADDLRPMQDSPQGSNPKKHVVVVMDGLEEFTTKPLEWALENLITSSGCVVTLLGVMPWLNILCEFCLKRFSFRMFLN